MSKVISVKNVSKTYRLGDIGGRMLREDVARWWAKFRGKPDPLIGIGDEHHARQIGDIFLALDNVSFEVQQGEVLGIIGRNGAGKSTLLKLLSQVTVPSSGQIKLRGRIASLLEVGTGFHPELTGRENVFLNGAILGMTKAEIRKKFDSIVAFSEIEDFINTPVKRYSSGMYVRLAFAVAAHLEPEILIVDEVLAVGDASFQKKCLGKMGQVSRDGRTILFVSHNSAAVRALCSKAILLKDGAVAATGTPAEVITLYSAPIASSETSKEWPFPADAPGDHRVRLKSVRLISPDSTDGLITVHNRIRIEFTYWNYVAGAVLNVSMLVCNTEDACVFASPSDFAPRPAGLVRHTVEIPGDFMNVGSYHVNLLIVWDASVAILVENNVVSFGVTEGNIMGNWYGQTPGAVRPKLTWHSEATESSDFAGASTRNQAN
jgi:lipopolysaccharide transport system ATP-binding protein